MDNNGCVLGVYERALRRRDEAIDGGKIASYRRIFYLN